MERLGWTSIQVLGGVCCPKIRMVRHGSLASATSIHGTMNRKVPWDHSSSQLGVAIGRPRSSSGRSHPILPHLGLDIMPFQMTQHLHLQHLLHAHISNVRRSSQTCLMSLRLRTQLCQREEGRCVANADAAHEGTDFGRILMHVMLVSVRNVWKDVIRTQVHMYIYICLDTHVCMKSKQVHRHVYIYIHTFSFPQGYVRSTKAYLTCTQIVCVGFLRKYKTEAHHKGTSVICSKICYCIVIHIII